MGSGHPPRVGNITFRVDFGFLTSYTHYRKETSENRRKLISKSVDGYRRQLIYKT